jgi:hypothetical protein
MKDGAYRHHVYMKYSLTTTIRLFFLLVLSIGAYGYLAQAQETGVTVSNSRYIYTMSS